MIFFRVVGVLIFIVGFLFMASNEAEAGDNFMLFGIVVVILTILIQMLLRYREY